MSDSNSSAVSIVGIIAIVILVVFVIYFFMLRPGGDGADLEIDINQPTSEVVPDQERSAPASLSFASFPG